MKRKRKSDVWRLTCLAAFVLAAVIAAVAAARLLFRFAGVGGAVMPAGSGPVRLLTANISNDAMVSVFTMFGLVNFSLPYIINIRNTSLYGIHLSRVISAQFPWGGHAYIVYALLVVMGLYCGRMGYLLTGAVCLTGVVFSYISTGMLAAIFVFRQETLAVEVIERYLTRTPRHEDETGRRKRLLESGDYIRAYFETNHTLPERVVVSLLDTFERAGGCGLGEGTQCVCSYDAADTVFLAHSVCARMLEGLDGFSQTAMLRRLLYILSEDLEERSIPADGRPRREAVTDRDRKRSAVLLCGLEAWRRRPLPAAGVDGGTVRERLAEQILSVDAYPAPDGGKKDRRFGFLLRLLVLLSGAAEAAWDRNGGGCGDLGPAERLLERYGLEREDAESFLSWGRVILLAAGTVVSDPPRCALHKN